MKLIENNNKAIETLSQQEEIRKKVQNKEKISEEISKSIKDRIGAAMKLHM